MKNLPDRIYLNFGDMVKEEFDVTDFDECSEITWCKDKVFKYDQEYIRTDTLWKDAQGDDLPEIDREVVVLVSNSGYTRRQNPYIVGVAKRIIDEGLVALGSRGYKWNALDVKYWLDLEMPYKEGGEG